jgi:hypothetical protein
MELTVKDVFGAYRNRVQEIIGDLHAAHTVRITSGQLEGGLLGAKEAQALKDRLDRMGIAYNEQITSYVSAIAGTKQITFHIGGIRFIAECNMTLDERESIIQAQMNELQEQLNKIHELKGGELDGSADGYTLDDLPY